MDLEGQSMEATVNWSPLTETWFLTLRFRDGRSVAEGRQMAPRVRLIRSQLFQGDLAVIPTDPLVHANPGRKPWGITHDLVYLTQAEVDSGEWYF